MSDKFSEYPEYEKVDNYDSLIPEEIDASDYIKGFKDGKEVGYQQGRVEAISEIKDKISEIDWYHIYNGQLVSGANSQDHEPLYKWSDIKGIFEQLK